MVFGVFLVLEPDCNTVLCIDHFMFCSVGSSVTDSILDVLNAPKKHKTET